MSDLKIVLIGHTLPDSVEMDLPKDLNKAKVLLNLHNFTHVVSENDTLIDHIAYLKKRKAAFTKMTS